MAYAKASRFTSDVSRLSLPEIGLQVFYIFVKRNDSGRGNPARSLRIIVFELFDNFNIAGFFELINLHTEVTRRGIGFFFYKSELRLLYTYKE